MITIRRTLPTAWGQYLLDQNDEVETNKEALYYLNGICPLGFYLASVEQVEYDDESSIFIFKYQKM